MSAHAWLGQVRCRLLPAACCLLPGSVDAIESLSKLVCLIMRHPSTVLLFIVALCCNDTMVVQGPGATVSTVSWATPTPPTPHAQS
jgi:hypothetical protein